MDCFLLGLSWKTAIPSSARWRGSMERHRWMDGPTTNRPARPGILADHTTAPKYRPRAGPRKHAGEEKSAARTRRTACEWSDQKLLHIYMRISSMSQIKSLETYSPRGIYALNLLVQTTLRSCMWKNPRRRENTSSLHGWLSKIVYGHHIVSRHVGGITMPTDQCAGVPWRRPAPHGKMQIHDEEGLGLISA